MTDVTKKRSGSGRLLRRFAAAMVLAMIVLAWWVGTARDRYVAVQGSQAQAMSDLLRCAEGMEQCGSQKSTYVDCLDTDNNGVGDANTGSVTPNICTARSKNYTISIQGPPMDDTYIVRGVPRRRTPVAGTGTIEIDSGGNRRWDRNDDGDFDDASEDRWGG
jgi:hypothetical protein